MPFSSTRASRSPSPAVRIITNAPYLRPSLASTEFVSSQAVSGVAQRIDAMCVVYPRQNGGMHTAPVPLIDITYRHSVGEERLRQLAALLPDIVAEAVDCPEEPWTGPPEPGDIEIRFREKSGFDVGELDVVIEVRTKLFASRLEDKQRRVDLLHDRLAALNVGQLGVWLTLAEGAWSQG